MSDSQELSGSHKGSTKTDREELKDTIDVLYVNRDEDIESVKALAGLGDSQAIEVIDAYEKIRLSNRASIGTQYHEYLIDIVTSYPDQTYNVNTFGEFLFGCIDVDITDVNQSCRPACQHAIVRNEHNYRKCTLPVWKLVNGTVTKVSDGEPGANRALLFIDSDEMISADVIPTELDTVEVYSLHGRDSGPSRFVGTFRRGQLVESSVGSLGAGERPSPKKSVSFNQIDSYIPPEPTVAEVISDTINDPSNPVAEVVDKKPGISQWVLIGAMIVAAALGIYLLYRYVIKPQQSGVSALDLNQSFQVPNSQYVPRQSASFRQI